MAKRRGAVCFINVDLKNYLKTSILRLLYIIISSPIVLTKEEINIDRHIPKTSNNEVNITPNTIFSNPMIIKTFACSLTLF